MVAVFAALAIIVRTRFHESRRIRQVRRVRDDRETRLEQANARRHGLQSMTELVDAIMRFDPRLAAELDLELLLDRYAELAIESARWRMALERIDAARLFYVRCAVGARRRPIVNRRLLHWQQCRSRWLAIEDELASVYELFAALALRVAARATS